MRSKEPADDGTTIAASLSSQEAESCPSRNVDQELMGSKLEKTLVVASRSMLPSRYTNTIQSVRMTEAFHRIGIRSVILFQQELRDSRCVKAFYGIEEPIGIRPIKVVFGCRRLFPIRALFQLRYLRAHALLTRDVSLAFLATRVQIPTVLELHDLPSRRSMNRLRSIDLSNTQLKGIICITHSLARDLEKELPREFVSLVRILPDAVDLKRFSIDVNANEVRRSIGVAAGDFLVTYSGHLYPGKGMEVILPLASACLDERFLIVGGHPADVQRWENECATRGITNISFTGHVPCTEVIRYLKASDVLLLPNQRRVNLRLPSEDIGKYTSPLKLFEYMAAQRPIVASDLPVLREILDDKCAVLCEPDAPDEWAAAVKAIRQCTVGVSDLVSNAFSRVQGYTWEARATAIASLLIEDAGSS